MSRVYSHISAWLYELGYIPFTRRGRQHLAQYFVRTRFGGEFADPDNRVLRLFEEVVETAQARGIDHTQLHRLIRFVYAKPIGDFRSETGGTAMTLLTVAESAGFNLAQLERAELRRVMRKPLSRFQNATVVRAEAGVQHAQNQSGAERRDPASRPPAVL